MLIIGAGGFAKEVLEIFTQKNELKDIAFYDDVDPDLVQLFGRFPILKDEQEVKEYFQNFGNEFVLGIGNSLNRLRLSEKFEKLGGLLTSCFSAFSRVGQFSVSIGNGTNILDHAIVSNNVQIGKGCLIYYQTVITHDCIIGDYVELSPGVKVLGRCNIGNFSQIGANATILPDIKIGKNGIVGAGAVVTKDVADYCVVAGVPARIIGNK